VNVGYAIEAEDTIRRTKSGQDFEILMTLYTRRPAEGPAGGAS
jgi:hypothetical protein